MEHSLKLSSYSHSLLTTTYYCLLLTTYLKVVHTTYLIGSGRGKNLETYQYTVSNHCHKPRPTAA